MYSFTQKSTGCITIFEKVNYNMILLNLKIALKNTNAI
jgi:hypothetical protein